MLANKVNKEEWFRMSEYIPHPGQSLLHASDARFKVVVSGRRWGKSLLAAKEAELMILKPQTRGWIVSKTYDLGEKVFREIYNTLVKRSKLETVRKSYSSKSGSMYLEFPWESVVEVKSAEHPDSLVGEGLDWLVFDECASCKSVIWEQYLRPTLSDKKGWAMFITTPRGYNWLYDLWKRGNDPDYPEWESFRFPSWNNPHLPKDDIEEAKRTLSKAAFEQEYGATFTFSSGQVYKEFDASIHEISEDKLKIDSNWRRFRSIDFGYENPFVCLYIAVDPEDRVIIYDEYYQRHKTMEQHASFLLEEEKRSKAKMKSLITQKHDNSIYEFTTCDPSAASARATLFEKGIVTIAPRSNIIQGLELVRRQLRLREDGKPGLYISSKCVNTIKEFNLYSYPETIDTEEPVKENDHAMDCLRYFLLQWHRGYIAQKTAIYA
jgi:PBSX family phage terminase large subunit